MTENFNRQPKGIPVGGQFAANVHAEPQVSLATLFRETSEEGQRREFWDRANADAVERQERIRRQQTEWAEARKAQGDVQEEPATYEYVPESVPPVHTGPLRRAFAALGSFSASVEERHQRDMAEIAALSRGGSVLPKFLRRKK